MVKNATLYRIAFRCASDVEIHSEQSAKTIDFQTQFQRIITLQWCAETCRLPINGWKYQRPWVILHKIINNEVYISYPVKGRMMKIKNT